jgi:hypothetical protein
MRILLLILAFVAVQAAAWFAIYRWLKRRLARTGAEVREACTRQGERIVLGPASSSYRGADFGYDRVKGNGVLSVTDRRIVFRKVVGGTIEIPLRDIAGVTVSKWFRGVSIGTGGGHLVLHSRDRNRIGFLVRNPEEWRRTVEALLPEIHAGQD